MRVLSRSLLLLGILILPAPAAAQLTTLPGDPSLQPSFQPATAGGQALTLPLGGIRNAVDWEGGTVFYDPVSGLLDTGKLRLNISGGEAVDRNTGKLVRAPIAMSPDVGGGTIFYDGRSHMQAEFVPSGIRFHWQPTFLDGLIACSPCMDVPGTLTTMQRRHNVMRKRVNRLARIVRSLRERRR